LPRRLGDDPLKRARAAGAASVALEPGSSQGSAQVGVQASHASYNDVFFQRRGDGSEVQETEARAPEAPEAPEISEISEIPEIREVPTVVSSPAPEEATPEAGTEAAVVQDAEVAQAPGVSIIEEVVARLNASSPAAVTAATEQPASPQVAAQAPPESADASKAEPQKGGFFKRLFGKLR
jgi:hypothetical protein